MNWVLTLYVAATVFGAGVTLIDMLGMLGDHSSDHGDGHDTAADETGGMDGHDSGGDDHAGGNHDDSLVDHSGDTGRSSLVLHDQRERGNVVFGIIQAARNLVYFSLGFGPVGLYAVLTGLGTAGSLIWSVPFGAVTLVGTRALRRLLSKKLDSQLQDAELLMEKGIVLVTIGENQMGKVRLTIGGTYADRFARAKDPTSILPVGTGIRVVDVTDECVIVEAE